MKKKPLFVILILILMSSVLAGSFVDDTQNEFNIGVYNWTQYGSSLYLNGELPNADVNSVVNTNGLQKNIKEKLKIFQRMIF
jgi:hypothetical protein